MAHFANRMQIELTAALSQNDGLMFRATHVSWHHCTPFPEIFCADAEEVVRIGTGAAAHPASSL